MDVLTKQLKRGSTNMLVAGSIAALKVIPQMKDLRETVSVTTNLGLPYEWITP